MNRTIGILHQSFPYGGAETATLRLAEGLSRYGYHIYVFCTDYRKDLANPTENYYEIQVMPDSVNINSEENVNYLLDKIEAYNISNFCISCNEFIPTLCQLKERGSHAKLIYIQHGQPFWEKESRLDASFTRSFHKLKIVLINRTKEKLFKSYTKRWQQRYAIIYDHCDFYVTLHPQYSQTIQTAIKRKGEKLIAIPNMIEPGFLYENKKKQLLYSGRMSRMDKRVDRLIKIWAQIHTRVPQWELVLVGDGRELPALKALTEQLQLPRVRFEGWQKDVKKYYQEASIICLTSTFESFGLCLTEAMSYGCVPIAYNCSAGVTDIIMNNGILIPTFRQEEYANRLVELMQNDNLRTDFQQNSFASIRRFYPENIIPQWIRLFERLPFSQ